MLISLQVVYAQSALENISRHNNSLDIRPIGNESKSVLDVSTYTKEQKASSVQTVVNINYGASDSTDYIVRMRANNRFPLAATDSFTYRSAIVAFDTLHDYISDAGYRYGMAGYSVTVDTAYFQLAHKRASTQNDTLILKVLH